MAGEQEAIAIHKIIINKMDRSEIMLDDKNSGRMVFLPLHVQVDGWRQPHDETASKGGGYVDRLHTNEKHGDLFTVGWAGECYPSSGPEGEPVAHCAGG